MIKENKLYEEKLKEPGVLKKEINGDIVAVFKYLIDSYEENMEHCSPLTQMTRHMTVGLNCSKTDLE